MDDPRGSETERLREAVQDVRASVHETVHELSNRVNKATDLDEHVRKYPLAALAIATVGGLIVGRQITVLLGLGGVTAVGASAALRAVPTSHGPVSVIVDRLINTVGAALTSAVLVPVVSGLQRLVESSWTQDSTSRGRRAASAPAERIVDRRF